MLLEDNISLIASAPDPVKFCEAQTVGSPGIQTFYYWIVANYPIGRVAGGPFAIRNAPDTLSGTQYVQIVWTPSPGATSYDVLRTDTPEFPAVAGNYALATGVTGTLVRDPGMPLSPWNPTVTPPSPVRCQIHLNNRDYNRPTLQIPCGQVLVSQLIFPDGSVQSTAGGGQPQTPWEQNIDGAGYSLGNVGFLGIGTAAGNFTRLTIVDNNQNAVNQLDVFNTASGSSAGAGIRFVNDSGFNTGTIFVGSSNYIAAEQQNSLCLSSQGGNIFLSASLNIIFSLNAGQGIVIHNLPTTDPGAGSNQLWADPADGYRVKWSA